MTLNTMAMSPTFPESDILAELEELEEQAQITTGKFSQLIYESYHRGCRQQQIRCMVQYMYHCSKSFDEAKKLFDYPLVRGLELREAVEAYFPVYAAMKEREK